jgi:hypothetical protein
MLDCEKLPGHLKAICTGEHRQKNGQSFSDYDRAEIIGRFLRESIDPGDLPASSSTVSANLATKSNVGTKLQSIIKRDAGDIECGECRDEVARLNLMSVDAVIAEMDSIAEGIVSRAKKKAPRFWQRWGAILAPSHAKEKALSWLREATGQNKADVFLPKEDSMTQFVYLNIIGPDNGEELRLSMASVRKNFTGSASFTIIGDKPNWYTGHHIPVPRLTKMRELPGRMAFRDTQAKIMLAASHPEIEEEFVHMMDDQFFLKPTSIEDLKVLRYDPWYRTNSKREWHRLIKMTFGALAANGKANFQAGTHLPHVFEKQKLQQMFVEYGFPNNLYLFEILYENHWQLERAPIPYGGNWQGVQYPQFLRRLLRSLTLRQLNEIDSNVLNYQSNVWRPVMRDWLKGQFTEE